ncbi:hypothetical protein CBM2587_B100121 [Cupriavidus taiwanensis]|uniref:Uncharacterized protein n=1 Tax=Cupriavidus taiwanensis TaxID=164546 RepID=A0A976A486_9BURK|nr:hypothetical protein CBM2587_B100121 [Cupriavidus taiwanensis]
MQWLCQWPDGIAMAESGAAQCAGFRDNPQKPLQRSRDERPPTARTAATARQVSQYRCTHWTPVSPASCAARAAPPPKPITCGNTSIANIQWFMVAALRQTFVLAMTRSPAVRAKPTRRRHGQPLDRGTGGKIRPQFQWL